MKNKKSRLVISFILTCIIVLSTIIGLATYVSAKVDTSKSQSYSQGNGNPAPGYVTVSDLWTRYDILCCAHGVHLPSANQTVLNSEKGSVTEAYLTQNDIGKKNFEHTVDSTSSSANSPFKSASYTNETFGYYKVNNTYVAKPMEAYILAEMAKEQIVRGHDSNVQIAWWNTEAGMKGVTASAPEALTLEAQDFEAYIKKIAKSTDPSTYTTQQYEFEVDGTKYTGQVKAPELNYEPKYNKDANQDGKEDRYDNITVSWNGEKYKIGPFSVNYVESKVKHEGRDEVMFAGITDAKIYTDLGEVPADKWKFVWLEGQRDANDTQAYPHTNEVFYIEMDFIENAKYFKNLHFDFKYMNAGGQYDELAGTYFKATWKPMSKAQYCAGGYTDSDGDDHPCSHGFMSRHVKSWTYWLQLTSLTSDESQLLAYGIVGARWYNPAQLDLDNSTDLTKDHKGKVEIKKVVVDENGNELTSIDDSKFTFKLYINDKLYDTIRVKANESVTETIKWKDGEETPTYRIEEVNLPDEYTVKEIENASGTMAEAATVKIKAINKVKPHKGYLKIEKKVTEVAEQDETYKFNIYIDSVLKDQIAITIPAGQTGNSVTVGPYEWNGSDAPVYRVEETEIPENVTQFNMINEKGKLVAGDEATPVTVTAINKNDGNKDYEGTIEITKQVTELAKEDEIYKFNVYINGELKDQVQITVPAGQTSNTVTVGPFKWKGDKAPSYEVKEVEIPSGVEQVNIVNSTGTLIDGKNGQKVIVTAINNNGGDKPKENEAKLVITKKVDGNASADKQFKFKITIGGTDYYAQITKDSSWSQTVKWKEGEQAPTYSVEEIDIPDGYEKVSITNASGTLEADKDVYVEALNKGDDKEYSGTIRVTKKVENSTDTNKKFKFKITIGDTTYTKELANGESWTENVKWIGKDNAPKYKVEEVEVPDGYSIVSVENAEGTMEENKTVIVKAINRDNDDKEHQGQITVKKEVQIDDKVKDEAIDGTFDFEVTIMGTFEMNGESVVNGSRTIKQSVKAGGSFTTPTIKWKGKNAPTYKVTETNLPDGWKLVDITNASGLVEDNTNIEAVCTNEYKITVEYELTMQMGGMVWHDVALNPDDKNTENSKPNGKYDAGAEEGIEKAQVTIKRYLCDDNGNVNSCTGNAKAWDKDGNEISWPIYTDIDGTWDVAKVEITVAKNGEQGRVRYGVEFGYDGQTYEPTTFLVTGNGDANSYKKASRVDRGNFFYDSMAIDNENDRKEFNAKFTNITGDEAINSNGETTGYSTDANGNKTATLDYVSTDSLNTMGTTRKESTLVTTTDDHYIKDDFLMKAETTTGGLTFPFDTAIHLESIDKKINELGATHIYKYSATYPYLLSINLGLVTRKEAELATTKDVYSAAVVINQKMLNYQYNQAIDFENVKYQDYLNLQVEVADADIEYTLDLYKTDYYYRAKIYEENAEVAGALKRFYKSLGYTAENALDSESDLDVYVTYKVSVYNDSQTYFATVNEITDYFDEDYELVEVEKSRYLQEANGVAVNQVTKIADSPYYKVLRQQVNGDNVAWETTNDNQNPVKWENAGTVKGSDGVTYNKIKTSSIKDEILASGERIDLYLTFRVKTDETSADGVLNCVRLGSKANVAEISNYTTYNSNNKSDIAGKVDKDSAPNNVNIEEFNEKTWYEDDTDSAPVITLSLYDTSREVNGIAWEDKEDTKIDNGYGQIVGNGVYDPGEELIANLTTELWEKVRVKKIDDSGNEVKDANGNLVYTEYDFLWPENYEIQAGKTLKELTGFDSTTKTGVDQGNKGQYGFTGVPTGNYVVRFAYGDSDETSAPANYDKDGIPAVYNGQDFKTVAYETGFSGITDTNSDGYVDNEWHNLENEDLANARVSDARDSEARRLEITSKSRILTNSNTTILNTANDRNADHTKLYEEYYMTADTAKINLNIENMVSLKKQKVNITNPTTGAVEEVAAGEEKQVGGITVNYVKGKVNLANGGNTSLDRLDFTYKVNNIDVGLEERASTEIKLDKQIENITLTDNTGAVILKADYDLIYTPKFDEKTGKTSIKVDAKLNPETSIGTDNLQALNRDEAAGLQNFRYIYYDNSIAQSLTLNVTYRFTALNLGEVDRIGLLGNSKFDEPQTILEEVKNLSESDYSYNIREKTFSKTANADGKVYADSFGKYLGSIYYEGSYAKAELDDIVTTRIDTLIDYVDNNAIFKAEENNGLNNSWRVITVDELAAEDSDIIDKNIITTYEDGTKNIEDSKGATYETAERYNIILSIENNDSSATEMSNKDFNVKLIPYSATKAFDANSDLDYNYTTAMKMNMTRSIDAEVNDEDLSFDNMAEIVKLDNTAGRRDVTTIAGNANPKEGEFATSLKERDASATELITFSPPTGMNAKTILAIQIALVTILGLGIVSAGIIVIKKKVLK